MRCESGCTCGRHNSSRPQCNPDCTCAKHRKRVTVQVARGERYGLLVALTDREGDKVTVRCDCGVERQMVVHNLVRQQTCGAGHHKRGAGNANYRHGYAPADQATSTYRIWAQMVQRTTNPQHPRWSSYGGRGIDLDPRWLHFPAFLEDMGERPDGLTIERVDNDRGYWPANCRWATYAEQRHNRRDTA